VNPKEFYEIKDEALEHVILALQEQCWAEGFKKKIPGIIKALKQIPVEIGKINKPKCKAMTIINIKPEFGIERIVMGADTLNMFKPEYEAQEIFFLMIHEYIHCIVALFQESDKDNELLFRALAVRMGLPRYRWVHGGQDNPGEHNLLKVPPRQN